METMNFGKRIKELRNKAGLSQRTVADAAGISFTYLSKIENGVMAPPGEEIIRKLADVLYADIDELLVLAGKVPSDIVSQIIKNPEILKSLRDTNAAENTELYSMRDGSFGKRLKELREKAGLSQSELADAIGVSFTYLSKIENGAKPAPSRKVIEKLADALRADSDVLMAVAGKLPSDVLQSLQNQNSLHILRGSIQNLNKRKNNTGRTKIMSVMEKLGKYKKLSRVAIPIMLVLAVAGSLWFGTPTTTRALQMEIANQPNGYYGLPYMFSVTVTIEQNELLPIQDVSLKITNTVDDQASVTYNNLPVTNGGTYTEAGVVDITASVSQDNQVTGEGYVVWQGKAYSFVSGDYYGPSTITYNVVWIPPAGWPEGTYTIDAAIQADAQTVFAADAKTFTLDTADVKVATSIAEDRYDDLISPYAVLDVDIDQITDAVGNPTTIPNGLKGFTAQIVGSNGIHIARVVGMPGYEGIGYDSATGVFGIANIASPTQPSGTIAQIFVQLVGSSEVVDDLSVAFTSITAGDDSNVPVENIPAMSFQRGDANGDGQILFNDCLYAARASVDTLDPPLVKLINAACPLNDGASGSIVRINDVLYIARRAVDTLTEYYTTYP